MEKLNDKEAYIKELTSTIEAKDKLLTETMKSTAIQQNNDIQVLHSHTSTESSIEVDADMDTKVDTKVSVSFRVLLYHL